MKKLILLLIAFVFCAASFGAVVSNILVGKPLRGGYTPTSTDWSNQQTYIYQWINANVVAALNVLTTKGDTYAYTGSSLGRVGGTLNQVLRADSNADTGVSFSTYTGEIPLTTKGDLTVKDSSFITRLPVGSNTQILGIADGIPAWVDTTNLIAFPRGSCIAWSPVGAGTTTIPTGWVLCDGTNSTPNLIGMFVIGTRPNGSSAGAALGGYGAYTCDGYGGGATKHSHTATWTPNPFTASGAVAENPPVVTTGSTFNFVMVLNHSHTGAAHPVATSSVTFEPSDYSLVYIMKQ